MAQTIGRQILSAAVLNTAWICSNFRPEPIIANNVEQLILPAIVGWKLIDYLDKVTPSIWLIKKIEQIERIFIRASDSSAIEIIHMLHTLKIIHTYFDPWE